MNEMIINTIGIYQQDIQQLRTTNRIIIEKEKTIRRRRKIKK